MNARSCLRIALCGIALATMASCSRHPAPKNTTTPGSLVFPAGIVAPSDWASAVRAGIYPSDSAKTCCFLSGEARLTLDNPIGSQVAVFTFYTPSVTPLRSGERIRFTFEGLTVGNPVELGAGMQDVTLSIPPSLRQRTHLIARLDMSVQWVPKRIGLNDDLRKLSVILIRVVYL